MIKFSPLILLVLFICCKDHQSSIEKRITVDRFYNLLDTTEVLNEPVQMTLLFDDEGIGFQALVSEDDIKASIFQHDTTIYNDPCVEFFLDPGADGKDYYEFEINAAGYGWALKLKTNQSPLNAKENISSWDIGRNYKARIISGTLNDSSDTDTIWRAIMAADYNSFSEGKPNKGDVWAYNFMRIDYDESNNPSYWVAKPTGQKMIHYPMTWPTITF